MNNNIKKLLVVDFDGTLCDSSQPEEGMKLYRLVTGKNWEHNNSWWSQEETLDTNIFNIKLFPKIVNEIESIYSDDTFLMIFTSRLGKFKSKIENILNINGFSSYDAIDLNTTNESKGDRLLDIIIGFSNLESIIVYDDRNIEVESFKSIVGELDNIKNYTINVVKDGNVIERIKLI